MSKSKNSHRYKDINKNFLTWYLCHKWFDLQRKWFSDTTLVLATPSWCNSWYFDLRAFKWDNLVILRDGLRMLVGDGCLRLPKVAPRVKTTTAWTTNNTTSFHYFSKKFKTCTLQGYKRYIKLFELEINNLRVQILAAKMT